MTLVLHRLSGCHYSSLLASSQLMTTTGKMRARMLIPFRYTELWKQLQSQDLKDLVLSETHPLQNNTVFGNSWELWKLKNLIKIEIKTPSLAKFSNEESFLPSLAKFLHGSPNLESLKLRLFCEFTCGILTSSLIFAPFPTSPFWTWRI